MSQTLSSSFARCYGLARVARVWKISRATVYRSLKETPPDTIARRSVRLEVAADADSGRLGRFCNGRRPHVEGNYALNAARSGGTPIMFMTRVRL
jgi:hypothetical protein